MREETKPIVVSVEDLLRGVAVVLWSVAWLWAGWMVLLSFGRVEGASEEAITVGIMMLLLRTMGLFGLAWAWERAVDMLVKMGCIGTSS